MRPSLVIFDCDGVLVDSERIAGKSMQMSLEALDLRMSIPDIRREFVGLSWPDVIARIETLLGRPIPDGWHERVKLQDQKWFMEQLEPVSGVEDAVKCLKSQKVPYCVASSGDIEKMTLTLGVTGLMPYFEGLLFSAAMVARGKPNPDLFLFAAQQMGHEPEVCVVIEDSVHGVAAARAAGMRVLAYAGDPQTDAEGLKRAGGVPFDSMAELPNLLGIN